MKAVERYPNITKAALEITYDNGGINRSRTEREMLGELDRFLGCWPPGAEYLAPIDAWLGTLTAEELLTICAGEQTEAQALAQAKGAPPFMDELLNRIFEEV